MSTRKEMFKKITYDFIINAYKDNLTPEETAKKAVRIKDNIKASKEFLNFEELPEQELKELLQKAPELTQYIKDVVKHIKKNNQGGFKFYLRLILSYLTNILIKLLLKKK